MNYNNTLFPIPVAVIFGFLAAYVVAIKPLREERNLLQLQLHEARVNQYRAEQEVLKYQAVLDPGLVEILDTIP